MHILISDKIHNHRLVLGHTLVIPKDHHRNLPSTPPATMSHIGSVLPRVARMVCEGVDAADFNIIQNNGAQAGQVVFHLHFHIIPRHATDVTWLQGATRIKRKRIEEEEAQRVGESIRARL